MTPINPVGKLHASSTRRPWLAGLRAAILAGSLAAMLPAQADGCSLPPGGMIGWWPGDGSAADIVGVNDGTLMGSGTYAPGMVGQAFNFDGSGACVELAPAWAFCAGAGCQFMI